MTVREVRHLPDSVLRGKAKRVSTIDKSILKLIDDMIATMQETNGVGLAAPQIGVPLRVVVLEMPEEEPLAIINPEIVKRSGEREVVEGCLSAPGYQGVIKRSTSITVKGLNRKGGKIRIKATDLMAQALEHELDHLNGVLYIDHIESDDMLYKIEPETGDREERSQIENGVNQSDKRPDSM
jgi:peptide deformylase